MLMLLALAPTIPAERSSITPPTTCRAGLPSRAEAGTAREMSSVSNVPPAIPREEESQYCKVPDMSVPMVGAVAPFGTI